MAIKVLIPENCQSPWQCEAQLTQIAEQIGHLFFCPLCYLSVNWLELDNIQCQRVGCTTLLSLSQKTAYHFIDTNVVCRECFFDIEKHARLHNLSLVDSFVAVKSNRQPSPEGMKCERAGCLRIIYPHGSSHVITSSRTTKIYNHIRGKIFCHNCFIQLHKLKDRLRVSIEKAFDKIQPKRHKLINGTKCSRIGCEVRYDDSKKSGKNWSWANGNPYCVNCTQAAYKKRVKTGRKGNVKDILLSLPPKRGHRRHGIYDA